MITTRTPQWPPIDNAMPDLPIRAFPAQTPAARRFAALLLLPALLAGCAGDANPVRDLAIASGVTGGEPKPAPDFVSNARRENTDYVPVGTSAPKRVYRPKTAAEVSDAEAELNRVRARNEARAAEGRRP